MNWFSIPDLLSHPKAILRTCVFVCCLLATANVRALDEAESLALLVQTLGATESEPAICNALLRGMLSGLEGRRNVPPPAGWKELSKRLSQSPDDGVREQSIRLSQIFGDLEATQQALKLLGDRSIGFDQRRSALRSLLEQQSDEVSEALEALLDEPELALDAIRGYSNVANPEAPAILLARYSKLTPELRRAVIETLATRKSYAEALLEAIKDKQITASEVPVHVARSLTEILGDSFTKVFGELRPIEKDREQLLAKYKQLVTPEALEEADASRGRAIYKKTCAACHMLYGEGGNVGPDLTGSNRANLDYILLNSVDPSYDVPDAYKMVQILTVDGVLAEEDAIRVVLKTAEQPRVVVAKTDIESRTISTKSMMPDGQLEQMKPKQVLDLIKYLRTTEQVESAE
jgi:putative heme-binding domain-containing protein